MRADVYRTIKASFWTDRKVRNLSRDAGWLFFYLMTNPHSHFCGLYYLPRVIISEESKLTAPVLRRCLGQLEREKIAFYDDENQVVFVRRMLVYQSAAGPKIVAGIVKQLSSLHETPLIGRFLNEYAGWSIPYRYPIDTTSRFGLEEQEQDQEEEQDQEKEVGSEPERNGSSPAVDPLIAGWLSETKNLRSLAVPAHADFWRALERAYDAYPWLYFEEEIRKADAWIEANPTRRPTERGLKRFMRSWFEKAVEFGRRKQNAQAARR